MPRGLKVGPSERRKWLEDFEKGRPTHVIAEKAGRRAATVKEHIERARREREIDVARGYVLRDTLGRHNAQLLGVLDRLMDQLHVPPEDRFLAAELFKGTSRATVFGTYVRLGPEGLEAAFEPGDLGDKRLEELLRQHLVQRKKLWVEIDRWRSDFVRYARTCAVLGGKAGENSSTVTRLSPNSVDRVGEGFHEDFIIQICGLALAARRHGRDVPDKPEIRITEERLLAGGTLIATSEHQRRLENARDSFTQLAKDLIKAPETDTVITLKDRLVEKAAALTRELTDIKLFGFVPGSCVLCGH